MTTFSNKEHAAITYMDGFCDDNAQAAVEEYQQQFPDHRVPDRRVFSNVYESISQTGAIPKRKC
jgi:hypothetical protein